MDLKSKYSVYLIIGLCLIVGIITVIAIKYKGSNNKPSNNSVVDKSNSPVDDKNNGPASNKSNGPVENKSKPPFVVTDNSSSNNTSNSTTDNTNNSTKDNSKDSNDTTANSKNQNNEDKKQPEAKKDDQPVDTKETSPPSEVPNSQDNSSKKANTPQENNKSQEAQNYDNLTKEQFDELIQKMKKDVIALAANATQESKIYAECEMVTQGLSRNDAVKKLDELKEKYLKEKQLREKQLKEEQLKEKQLKEKQQGPSKEVTNTKGYMSKISEIGFGIFNWLIDTFNSIKTKIKELRGRTVNISQVN
jgi:hypothetical protein